ncbi:MAG TPA: tetratricopeptide repeat protein [Longimicrobiales bacterium]|nr:tetratricopeptide repeat protein [Longimicrobiales bacterium]
MNGPDLQRWSRDVAEDPGSPSFVPLARAYRRQGQRQAALNVTLRGLERNPEHVEGHALLALLYVDVGERQKAGDEWDTMLRLDPENFDARRGLGFLALERGDLEAARIHLGMAARARAGDPSVGQALDVLMRREAANAGREEVGPGLKSGDGATDPVRLFDPLARETPFLGALLLDHRGLVVAGALNAATVGDGEALGALLTPAVDEARRTVALLDLGSWEGMLLDCDAAALHVAPAGNGVLVVAARNDAPAGWVVRTAARARELARPFLEDQS